MAAAGLLGQDLVSTAVCPTLGSLACADDAVDADGQFNQCDRVPRAGKQVTDPPASSSAPLPSRVAAHLSVFLRFCSPGHASLVARDFGRCNDRTVK